MIKILDELFREFIRVRAIKEVGGCERCRIQKYDIVKENGDIFPAWKQLQTSHFIGRSRRAVRWDEDNACGLCGACHLYFTSHPFEHTEWFKTRLGDRFELLLARTRNNKPDKALIALYLREKIKELKERLYV